ncbi:hypothetical protein KAH27_03755, partial [bacterium]|nr:hypothetical protein [bacterium]
MKNLLIKLSLITALVVACNTALAAFTDSPNTLALWHCDSTNWDGGVELTPDDNSSGRTAHNMQINVTNEAVMTPGSPYGGSYLTFGGADRALGLDVLSTHTNILQVDLAFRATELPAADSYDVIIYPHALEVLLYDGGHIRVLAFDAAGNPYYLQSSKAINIDTWYTVSAVASNGYVQVTVGNDTEGYETDGMAMGVGLYEGFHDIPIGYHPFAPATDTSWTFHGDIDEISIKIPEIIIPDIIFTDIPKDMQVCPRLPSTNFANVKIAGEIFAAGYDFITVKVYRESVLQSVLTQAVVYSAGKANFNLLPSIKAELANYDFIIALLNGSTEEVVAT